MLLLSNDELGKLRDPLLFYNISDINYDFQINHPPDSPPAFSTSSKLFSTIINVSSSYKPVFITFKDIYLNSTSANNFRSVLFTDNDKAHDTPLAGGISGNNKCIILVHGFKSRNKKIYIQLGKRYARDGIDGLVYTLPFHFERQHKDEDGRDVLDLQDLRGTLEFFRQTVTELRILIRILKNIGYKTVGMIGFSFGGYCCSLLACLDKEVDFIISMASMGDFGNLLKFKKDRTRADLDDEKDKFNDFLASNYLKLICPINFKPVIDVKNILFIQGLIDGRAPFRDVLKFQKRWSNPKVIWYPCDHSTFFLFNRLTLKLTAKFIKQV